MIKLSPILKEIKILNPRNGNPEQLYDKIKKERDNRIDLYYVDQYDTDDPNLDAYRYPPLRLTKQRQSSLFDFLEFQEAPQDLFEMNSPAVVFKYNGGDYADITLMICTKRIPGDLSKRISAYLYENHSEIELKEIDGYTYFESIF
jgi:hypothetical protein